MKHSQLLYAFLLFIPIILSSCSSDDDAGTVLGEGRWRLGNFRYNTGVSNQNTNNGIVAIVASTIDDNSQGAASGSTITLLFNDLGPGTYQILESIVDPDLQLLQVMAVSCTIGTSNTNGTRYESADNPPGFATVTLEDGEYSVTIDNEITLFKTVDIGDGVPNAEDEFQFIAIDID